MDGCTIDTRVDVREREYSGVWCGVVYLTRYIPSPAMFRS